MTTIIPHKLFGGYLKDVPVIMELLGHPSKDRPAMIALKEQLFKDITDSHEVDIECDKAFIVPQQKSAKHRITRFLHKKSMLGNEDEANTIFLPIDPRQAFFFNRSCYSDPSMASYLESFDEGVSQFLEKLDSTQDIKKAEMGDKDASDRLFADFRRFLDIVKRGLLTGSLNVGVPYNPHPEELYFLFSGGHGRSRRRCVSFKKTKLFSVSAAKLWRYLTLGMWLKQQSC